MRREVWIAAAAVAAVVLTGTLQVIAAAEWAGMVGAKLEALERRVAGVESLLYGRLVVPGAERSAHGTGP